MLVAVVSVPSEAVPWTRTQTCGTYGAPPCEAGEEPKPLQWPMRCVRYVVHEDGTDAFPQNSDDTIGDEALSLIRASFQTWSEAGTDCSHFTLEYGGLTETGEAEFDSDGGYEGNENVVAFHDDSWPYSGSSAAYSLTSVSYSTETGDIEDADIEVNTANYDVADLEMSRVGEDEPPLDLRNSLTHEVGHFLGLAHSDEPEATMYGRAPLGEIEKRTLHEDDIGGLCAAYPKEGTSGECDDPADFRPPDSDTGTSDVGTGDAGAPGDTGPDAGDDAGNGTDASGGEVEEGTAADGCGACTSTRPGGVVGGSVEFAFVLIVVAALRRSRRD